MLALHVKNPLGEGWLCNDEELNWDDLPHFEFSFEDVARTMEYITQHVHAATIFTIHHSPAMHPTPANDYDDRTDSLVDQHDCNQ